jgi:NADH:ubiquinone oxidoreductase subunit 6 (subunit J)
MDDYTGKERRLHPPLTEEMMDRIAEKAAKRVMDNMYREVGRSLMTKFVWALGVLGVAVAMWLTGKAPGAS